MDRTAGQSSAPRRVALCRLRWPLLTSLLLHGLILGAAVWWAMERSVAKQAPVVGSLELRPAALEPDLVPEVLVEPPRLEDEFDFADALEHVVLETPPVADEVPFDDEAVCELSEPLTCFEVPLTAARGRAPPPTPAPVGPARVAPKPPPPPRPTVIRVRPTPRPPPRPRAVPAPMRNPPLRVVFAPDRRRYYPPAALRRGLGGRTLVRLTIDAQGRVTAAHVVQTSGHASLDRAAVALAYAYRFTSGYGMRATRLPVSFEPPARRFGS
jgi:TonB family protein